jgi:hypothetical protein
MAVLFPHISISFRFPSAIALPLNSLYPEFPTTSNTASSFTAALLTYTQYFEMNGAMNIVLLVTPHSQHKIGR